MRSLIVSSLCIMVIVLGWMFFINFSEQVIYETVDLIDNKLYNFTENSDWPAADEGLAALQESWQLHRGKYMFFVDQAVLFNIDTTLSQASAYIKARSRDQAMGELSSLKTQLLLLHQRESLTWSNII